MKFLVAALVVLVNGIITAQAAPPQKGGTATSNGARFINPKEAQIFHPGDTVPISIDLDPKIEKLVKAIGIISSIGDLEFREAPPYSFTIAVPAKQLPGSGVSLIGFQKLYLAAVLLGRENNIDDLATTTVDVEEPDPPVSLEVVGPLQPIHNRLMFLGLGEDSRIAIYARFPDGHESDVTNSTYLSISSENPAIAFVVNNETVVSVKPGQTRIVVTYKVGQQQKQVLVPVTVEGGWSGIEVSPAFFNFGDVRSNAVSKSLQVTVTNHTQDKVHISGPQPTGGFLIGLENCADAILPAGGSCTFTITFAPIDPGAVYSTIYVGNDQTGPETLFLLGNGF
jgi:hypothetical protein